VVRIPTFKLNPKNASNQNTKVRRPPHFWPTKKGIKSEGESKKAAKFWPTKNGIKSERKSKNEHHKARGALHKKNV
jgi:hypothetical protein